MELERGAGRVRRGGMASFSFATEVECGWGYEMQGAGRVFGARLRAFRAGLGRVGSGVFA